MAKSKVDDDTRARQLTKTLLERRGRAEVKKLFKMFGKNITVEKIGRLHGVSKQRASQWKRTLGVEERTYQLRPCVQEIIEGA